MASARVETVSFIGLLGPYPAAASSFLASAFCFTGSPMPGSVPTSACGRPHTPDGRGCIAPPKVAAPWRGPTRYALRSSARLIARRTPSSVSGARLALISTLSFTLESLSITVSSGLPFLAVSAFVRFQPLPATSSCPACKAAICVERSLMCTHFTPSR